MNCVTQADVKALDNSNEIIEAMPEVVNSNETQLKVEKVLVPERKEVPKGPNRIPSSVKMDVKNELVKVAKESIDLLSQAVAADGLLVVLCIRDKDKLTYYQNRYGLATEAVLKSTTEIKNLLLNSLIE